MSQSTYPVAMKCLGNAAVTDTSSAVGLPSVPDKTELAIIQPTANTIKFTSDGSTTPTAAVGILIAVGVAYEYRGEMSKFSMIDSGGVATRVDIQYYGAPDA